MKKSNTILYIALILLLVPIITFFVGYLKLYISIPCLTLLFICTYKLIRNENIEVKFNFSKIHVFIIIVLLILFWLYFSGIGSFSYQNEDHEVRNAVLHDLIDYKWPVTYDFTGFSKKYQNIVGAHSAKFVYYFSYWLPASVIGKITNYDVANIFLFLYSFAMLLVIFLLIKNTTKLNPIYVLLIFIFFSGLDFLTNIGGSFNFSHLERFFTIQYSSNTTLLYWVFNQALPIWLITILIMHFKKVPSIIFIGCLSFCYSPFATIGLIPICIGYCLKQKDSKEKLFRFINHNIVCFESLFMFTILIIFGTFYLSSQSSISFSGFTWVVRNMPFPVFIIIYLIFIFVEILIYALLIRNKYKNDLIYKIIFIELLLFPLYCITPANDFCMRASISALFIFMIFIIKYLEDKYSKNRMLLVLVLLLGMFTSVHEIERSIYNTFTMEKKDYIRENDIKSIGNPNKKDGLILCNNQFYSKNYKNKFFFKYLSK